MRIFSIDVSPHDNFPHWITSDFCTCSMHAIIGTADELGSGYQHDGYADASALDDQCQGVRRTLTGSGTWYSI